MAAGTTARYRGRCLFAAAVAAAGALAGCAEEPGPDPLDSDFRPIRISVNADSEEQRVLGEIYQRALNVAGKSCLPLSQSFMI